VKLGRAHTVAQPPLLSWLVGELADCGGEHGRVGVSEPSVGDDAVGGDLVQEGEGG